MRKDHTHLKKFVKRKIENAFWMGYVWASIAAIIAIGIVLFLTN